MSPEGFSPQEQPPDVEAVRHEVEENIFQASDIVEQKLPEVPDKQMLRHLLAAAGHLVGPAYQHDAWRRRAPLLRADLEAALAELRQLEDNES
jgi:hypothetical protein